MSNQQNIERFEKILTSINRDGMHKLLDYIRKSDFYTAPASTKYHSCHEGGLLEHSLNVYTCLIKKIDNPIHNEILKGIDPESLAIVALLHDICKTNFYTFETRNVKVYRDTGKKIDALGRFDWESVVGYTVDDKIPYGHGEKSVMMIEEFIKLKPMERYAIRWHMGFTEPKDNWNTMTAALKKYPLILSMHEADLEATYFLEKEE